MVGQRGGNDTAAPGGRYKRPRPSLCQGREGLTAPRWGCCH